MKKASGFEKFYKGGPKKGAAKREEIRKDKRTARKEREEKIKQAKAARTRFGGPQAGAEKRAVAPKYNLEAPKSKFKVQKAKPEAEQMPLNKYIAHGGVCSRRDAVELIKGGKVKVNGELVTEPGHKVNLSDTVVVAGKKITPVKDFVYILLNKPKDYLTTTDDPQQRKTVLDLLKGAPDTRIYPVGRLDRNTSGVLLLTNDGDLSQMLTHPSHEVKKVYAVTLDKPLTKAHFEAILKGVPLEDGMAHVNILAYTDPDDHTQVGVEIHSGRNRIVRRIFEHFGYDVKGLDRVVFAGLTKKNVNRGKWRFLTEKEVRDLKFFGKGKG
jgi:23S rRNA pseudouridine2605 synthase